MVRRWRLAVFGVFTGGLVAAAGIGAGRTWSAVLLLIFFLGYAFVLSPLFYPRESADDGRPVIYWRPGCRYCLRMRARLGPDAAKLRWVDIWKDPEAAGTVRRITGGDETVPTLVIAGQCHVNPEPSWVRKQLAAAVP
ncbi:glutaredoxin domain-containing protein [Actinoplanes subglobosus]|uniref:Glutaredoxin domain-containing protein n=1 Tax=Actinoplanes subglobosus TaxID=1547892 RepID=A0ABV8IPP9_9ACTN